MSTGITVRQAIARAERLLPGEPAPEGKPDARWQAIIRVGEFIKTQPEAVWQFAHRWGKHAQADVRRAVATCLLEHLLERHFDLIFPRVRRAALASVRFADTFRSCWSFGQSEESTSAARMESLRRQLSRTGASRGRRT
jgi:hypothetical protein